MTSLPELLQHGSAWVFFPTAVLIGALHGLEPGHSKTMMAALIVAVRGTVLQAALLGLSAAISHSLVIWAIAAMALSFGQKWNAETTEPYFQMVGGILVMAMAGWTFWRMKRDQRGHAHHHHHDEAKEINCELGAGQLRVIEDGVPPQFRLELVESEPLSAASVETIRPDGRRQLFRLGRNGSVWESGEPIPEPHEFRAEIHLVGDARLNTVKVEFREEHDHAHPEDDDAHSREHAADIARRFTNRTVTTPQIVLFGLTGGLMPCPAAFSVLVLCLQLKKFALGFSLVIAFSLGLALTLVTVGVVAAWSVGQASRRFKGLGKFARLAPYLSLAVLLALGSFLFIRGVSHFG
ncbi:MAG TPA: sulfite exporter TauE/SafE family protein [Opitutaceae bacterium]|jgi:nickel/cobalt exporter|nr:sulfite exporter TauE/SafE family protein [Opitutaceae bacterium]